MRVREQMEAQHLAVRYFSLLYRRVPFSRKSATANTLQVENLRYGRVQPCATSRG